MTEGENPFPDDWSEFTRFEDMEEVDYDPDKWRDPETGEVTDHDEMFRQVTTLIKRNEYETVAKVATEQLARAEHPAERTKYILWLAWVADEQSDPRIALFHLENSRDSETLYLDASTRSLEVKPRLRIGDYEAARSAVRDSFELYRRAGEEGEFDAMPPEMERDLRAVITSNLVDAEIYWFEHLVEAGETDELRTDAEGRLVDPLPGEAIQLYRALALCERAAGDPAAVLRHVRAGERVAEDEGQFFEAGRFAAWEAQVSIEHFRGLSARAAWDRAAGHLEMLMRQPGVSREEAGQLLQDLRTLEPMVPRGGLIL